MAKYFNISHGLRNDGMDLLGEFKMKKLLAVVFVCVLFAYPAQAKRYYQLKGNHYVRVYPDRSYHRVSRSYRVRSWRVAARRFDQPERRAVEIGLLGAQRPIEFQYAIGNAVAEALSGSWPYPEVCQPSNVTWLK